MPKTKILYISHSPYMYGAESCLVTLVQCLDRKAFDPVVVVPAEGPLKDTLDRLGVKTYLYRAEWWAKNEERIFLGEQDNQARIQELVDIIEREKPDVVQSNTSVIWEGAIAASITGTRHIWHIHEMLTGHPSIAPILPIPLLYKAIDLLSEKVVVVSSEARDEVAGFVSADKLMTIHNGIDGTNYTTASDSSLRLEMGFAPEDIVALTVASLRKYKGVDNLIEAAAKTKDSGVKLKFVVAGKGPDDTRAELEQKICSYGLLDTVYLLGHRTDIPKLLAGADLFVLPSLKEAFPLVVLEAMASGKPVIATNCGGTAEMIRQGETGFVVPVNDPEALARRVIQLAASPKKMAAMGQKGYRRFTENYEAKIYGRRFKALYEEVLESPKSSTIPRGNELMFSSFLDAYQRYIHGLRTVSAQELQLAELNKSLAELKMLVAELNTSVAERDKSVAELNKSVAERDKSVAELNKSVAELNKSVAERDKSVAELNKSVAERDKSVAERDKSVAERDRTVAARDNMIITLKDEAAQATASVLTLTKQVTEQHSHINQRNNMIAERDLKLAEMSVLNSSYQERLVGLEQQKKNLSQHINELESQLQKQSVELTEREQQMLATAAELAQSEEERSRLEIRLQEKAAESASREERIQQLQAEMNSERQRAEQTQHQMNDKLAVMDRELEQRNHLLDQLHTQLAQLSHEKEAERCRLEAVVAEKENIISDLLNSRSWRITAPLRKGLDIFQKK